MERFPGDWATARMASEYAAHLHAAARKSGELPADPRYKYLKANAAKRRRDAPRGTRPGVAKVQGQASKRQDPGSSRAVPSPPDVNTTADEETMNDLSLFGFRHPSDNEDEIDTDDSSGSEGRK